MGKSYSLNGYVNAVLRRSCKTFLVEGPSDKTYLHRIEHEKFPEFAGSSVIDHAGMLDGVGLSGLGNKAKIQALLSHVDALSLTLPKLLDVLATLTDREWDDVVLNSYVPSPGWGFPIQRPQRFVTIGHSIENYIFDSECVCEFLKYLLPDVMTSGLLNEVRSRFDSILLLAAIASLKIRDIGCLGRSDGLVRMTDVQFRGDRVYLLPSFGVSCAGRQISCASSIVSEVNSAVDLVWDDLFRKDYTKWLSHGHLGDDFIWACVARTMLDKGVEQNTAREIGVGFKGEKSRFKAQWLSKVSEDKRPPLDDAVEWLYS